ncbi:MAG: VanZ family protein [Candidatus Faecousia sp.]|nr:VanZ family protein [Candidatus Faecousia sp.]
MKKSRVIYLCLTVLALGFIWGNSAMPGDISGEISGSLFEVLEPMLSSFGDKGEFILRKIGHFSEFTMLGFLLSGLTRPGKITLSWLPVPLFLGLACACLDETIQIFSPGRFSTLTDVWIDFSGVCLGLLLSLAVYALINRHANTPD